MRVARIRSLICHRARRAHTRSQPPPPLLLPVAAYRFFLDLFGAFLLVLAVHCTYTHTQQQQDLPPVRRRPPSLPTVCPPARYLSGSTGNSSPRQCQSSCGTSETRPLAGAASLPFSSRPFSTTLIYSSSFSSLIFLHLFFFFFFFLSTLLVSFLSFDLILRPTTVALALQPAENSPNFSTGFCRPEGGLGGD